MAKLAVSCDAFRGLFAFYATKAHHGHKDDAEHRLLKLFGSAEDLLDSMLEQWSEGAELLGSETDRRILEPCARRTENGSARYDHASGFLHALLRDMERKIHCR
ncbi:hypothetical protein GGD65_006907 [Bradyrhizobium sp. CIR18]|uniref:hypothetical protein n=1 Tax=Bradyrhizobium sp. CIR18 TaxID=2663839 RepID=UPI00160598A9|nr:hypothetical protein [Bradyrhizobium sp. CIR18]MBB4365838.1 hypothetical protein [Bradyrhizobium sp. CIR18]